MRILRTFAALGLFAVGACRNTDDLQARDAHVGPTVPPSVAMSAATNAASSDPPTVAAPTATASGDKVYDQTATAIDAKVGDHFVVAVPGNATTAFTWRLDPKPDAAVLSVADPQYTPAPPPGCTTCVGYGGTYSFAVTTNAAGSAKLRLVKVHVGRVPGAPAQEVNIAVTVRTAK